MQKIFSLIKPADKNLRNKTKKWLPIYYYWEATFIIVVTLLIVS